MPIFDRVLVSEDEVHEPDEVSNWPVMRIADYFEQVTRKNIDELGDSDWLTDISTGRSMSYSQLLSSVKSMAASFWKKGLRLGDMVLVISANFIELPIIFLGVWKCGGSVASLTLNLLKSDIRQRVQQLRPKFVVTDEARLVRVRDAVQDLDFIKEVLIVGKAENCTTINDFLLDDGTECPENVEYDFDSMVWLMYSSGTTGVPKGIVHTHRSLVGILHSLTSKVRMRGRKFLFINLMVNSGGMSTALLTSLQFANMYCISDLSDDNLLAAIDRVKPFGVSLFPNQIAWICRHPNLNQYDLSSVVFLLTVGSTLHPKYERDIFDKMPNLLMENICYGCSETGIICTNRPSSTEMIGLDKSKAIARHVIGSSGKVYPYCQLKVIDRLTGEKLGPLEEGEICVRSPFMMKEYLNMPEETANFLRDGWAHTGDKGYYDNNENVFIIGRYKELIKYRMAHVLPSNIEKQLMTHPAVEDVGVVGLPHDVDGELPLAFVVQRTGMTTTTEELIEFIKDKVVDEETLRGGVRFIDRIPRNELGKIVRPLLMNLL